MTKIKNIFLIFTVFIFGSASLMAKTQLTVYTAVEAEDLKKYAATLMRITQILKSIGSETQQAS